jgi:hypothetical protein
MKKQMVDSIENIEIIMCNLYGLIYSQNELISRLNCKVASSQNMLNLLEIQIADLKSKKNNPT